MNFLKPIIEKRLQLINNGLEESLHDALFVVKHSKEVIQDIKVYVLPYENLSNIGCKPEFVEKIVDKIIEGSFLKDNNIGVSGSNLILFHSFDTLSSLESCYLFDLETGSVELKILDPSGNIIINRPIREKLSTDSIFTESNLQIPYYLFFDTETTGLPANYNAPISEFDNWPRLIQLAYLCYDKRGNEISRGDYIIRPDGFEIPLNSSNIHGITGEKASKEGLPLSLVLEKFGKMVDQAEILVGHNISFDEKIVACEFLRLNLDHTFSEKKKICTMKDSTNLCAIEGPYGFKWPTLSELHFKLFETDFQEAHNAMVDVMATAKCFWELEKRFSY